MRSLASQLKETTGIACPAAFCCCCLFVCFCFLENIRQGLRLA